MTKSFIRICTLLIALGSLGASVSYAETPTPTIIEPKDASLKCVQPEEEMRRNHMNYILHQRDKTMREGIRTERYSLAKCIDCHVEPDANGEIARVDSEKHFCKGCHQYAAVKIDCFECHADRPQKYIQRANNEPEQALAKQLNDHLEAKGLMK